MRERDEDTTWRRPDTYQRAISQSSKDRFIEDLERRERAEATRLVREAISGGRAPARAEGGSER